MPEWKREISRCREPLDRGHGLHRQRPGRIQTRRYRHFPARHRRKTRPPRSLSMATRSPRCSGADVADQFKHHGRRLYRKALRQRPDGSGGIALWQKFPAHAGYASPKRRTCSAAMKSNTASRRRKSTSCPSCPTTPGQRHGYRSRHRARRRRPRKARLGRCRRRTGRRNARGRAKAPPGTEHHLDRRRPARPRFGGGAQAGASISY